MVASHPKSLSLVMIMRFSFLALFMMSMSSAPFMISITETESKPFCSSLLETFMPVLSSTKNFSKAASFRC